MFILFTESSPNLGGQELQAIAWMVEFKKKGYQILLACRPGSNISVKATTENIPVTYIPFRNSTHIPSILIMTHLIQRYSPDIIICHSGHDSNIVGIARILIRYRFKSPYVIRLKTYLTKRIKSFSLNYLNDTVIVPGKFVKNQLVEAGCIEEKIQILHPGFDFDKMEKDSQYPLPLHIRNWIVKHNELLIVQVGMLRKEKAHDFMLRVLTRLKNDGYSFRYLIVGEGSSEDETAISNQIKESGLQEQVLMAGSIFPVMPVYRIADVVVMPSRNESFGMAIVEASFFSVPVIASNTGGISEIIQHNDNGTLLSVDDEDSWYKTLKHFQLHPEHFKTMAKKAKKDVEYRFSLRSVINKVLSLTTPGKS